MNYRERIRKAIECPQFGDETYGEWGALNLEQRKFIKRLLDELDRADNYIKKVYLENQELKKQLECSQTNEETYYLEMQDITKILGFSEDTIFDEVKQYASKLKKQLEVGKEQYNDLVEEKENQQKEFIEYLESEINKIKEQIKNYDIWHEVGTDINFLILKKQFNIEILSKYKEIIGDVKNENK